MLLELYLYVGVLLTLLFLKDPMATTQAAFTAEVRHISGSAIIFALDLKPRMNMSTTLLFPVLPYCFISSLLQRLFAVSFSGHHQEFPFTTAGMWPDSNTGGSWARH